MTDANLPIGVFDSGVGGLTVLAALRRHLPGEDFIYLGDTARLPYGTKSAATVERYARQAAGALVARGIKVLVVACNTASATALCALAQEFAPLPVFGVVEPGALAACEVADSNGVTVLATESTIAGGAYQRALLHQRSAVRVLGRPCRAKASRLIEAVIQSSWQPTGWNVSSVSARRFWQKVFRMLS